MGGWAVRRRLQRMAESMGVDVKSWWQKAVLVSKEI